MLVTQKKPAIAFVHIEIVDRLNYFFFRINLPSNGLFVLGFLDKQNKPNIDFFNNNCLFFSPTSTYFFDFFLFSTSYEKSTTLICAHHWHVSVRRLRASLFINTKRWGLKYQLIIMYKYMIRKLLGNAMSTVITGRVFF